MKKKIICILILFLLIFTCFQTYTVAFNIIRSTDMITDPDTEIFKDIEKTEGKSIIIDKIIGNVHVKYWEHVFDDLLVINDSILLHLDIETGNIIKYKKSWTDIDDLLYEYDYDKGTFEPDNYLKKQLVVFPDESDCTYFYTFQDYQEYPVICWEVWYSNGATILYNFVGEKIGYGTPTPSKGFSLSGYDYNPQYPDDPWIHYRKNADYYFKNWCEYSKSLSLPLKDTVSSYVKDSSVQFFYEIAHGDYTDFLINDQWERYYFSTARKDMENRPPMKFAFIGSCNGMNYVGPNSFSYEFRKGKMNKTVTIGYCNMTHSAWKYAYQWQDHMFKLMNEQKTIYDSFIEACAEYPVIAENVVFFGDEKLTVQTRPRPDSLSILSNIANLVFKLSIPRNKMAYNRMFICLLNQIPVFLRLLSLKNLIN